MASRVKGRRHNSNRDIDFAKLLVMGVAIVAIDLYHSLLVIHQNEAQDTAKEVMDRE